jgi:hypothetical protein
MQEYIEYCIITELVFRRMSGTSKFSDFLRFYHKYFKKIIKIQYRCNNMEINEHISYWIDSSLEDIQTAYSVFDINKFKWSLFIAHLALEK